MQMSASVLPPCSALIQTSLLTNSNAANAHWLHPLKQKIMLETISPKNISSCPYNFVAIENIETPIDNSLSSESTSEEKFEQPLWNIDSVFLDQPNTNENSHAKNIRTEKLTNKVHCNEQYVHKSQSHFKFENANDLLCTFERPLDCTENLSFPTNSLQLYSSTNLVHKRVYTDNVSPHAAKTYNNFQTYANLNNLDGKDSLCETKFPDVHSENLNNCLLSPLRDYTVATNRDYFPSDNKFENTKNNLRVDLNANLDSRFESQHRKLPILKDHSLEIGGRLWSDRACPEYQILSSATTSDGQSYESFNDYSEDVSSYYEINNNNISESFDGTIHSNTLKPEILNTNGQLITRDGNINLWQQATARNNVSHQIFSDQIAKKRSLTEDSSQSITSYKNHLPGFQLCDPEMYRQHIPCTPASNDDRASYTSNNQQNIFVLAHQTPNDSYDIVPKPMLQSLPIFEIPADKANEVSLATLHPFWGVPEQKPHTLPYDLVSSKNLTTHYQKLNAHKANFNGNHSSSFGAVSKNLYAENDQQHFNETTKINSQFLIKSSNCNKAFTDMSTIDEPIENFSSMNDNKLCIYENLNTKYHLTHDLQMYSPKYISNDYINSLKKCRSETTLNHKSFVDKTNETIPSMHVPYGVENQHTLHCYQRQEQNNDQALSCHHKCNLKLQRKLIRPSKILCYQLHRIMPLILEQFESSVASRKGLCRQLTGRLYPNSPKPSPNFLLNTLLPVYRAADYLGFNWKYHMRDSLSYMRLWVCNQLGGKELIQRFRIEYNAPTGKEYLKPSMRY